MAINMERTWNCHKIGEHNSHNQNCWNKGWCKSTWKTRIRTPRGYIKEPSYHQWNVNDLRDKNLDGPTYGTYDKV
jgi:hypothetical protein